MAEQEKPKTKDDVIKENASKGKVEPPPRTVDGEAPSDSKKEQVEVKQRCSLCHGYDGPFFKVVIKVARKDDASGKDSEIFYVLGLACAKCRDDGRLGKLVECVMETRLLPDFGAKKPNEVFDMIRNLFKKGD